MVYSSLSSGAVSPGHVIGPYIVPLLEAAARHGLSVEQMSLKLGKPSDWLDPLPYQISVTDYLNLMAVGAEVSSSFGLDIGAMVRPNTFPVLGYAAMSCSTIGQVLDQVIRFEMINHDLGRSVIGEDGHLIYYCWQANPLFMPDGRHPVLAQLVGSVFSGLYNFSRYLTNSPVPLIRMEFTFPAPEDVSPYQGLLDCEILFDQPHNILWVDRQVLEWPVSNADHVAFTALSHHAELLLEQQNSSQAQSVLERLHRALLDMLRSQQVGIEPVARRLNMSARTLQRKLKEEGTSYQIELDRIRKELAESYLEHSRLSISEIAFLLGYQEQSSFTHAFRDWLGLTPGAYRQKVLGRT
ncbi:helix-turn-helix domain-containing protein [Hahella ganghwensis]|uniref:helix-turn-helix domain-containing protein n=1 Tax=Hahella ganghwensis TaxID=286420 RepID=UPI00037E9319|nr:AraC family transcriptional regulator [Hahella ganghwensis]